MTLHTLGSTLPSAPYSFHLLQPFASPPQALNERKVEIRVQYKAPVQMPGATVHLERLRNELVMRCAFYHVDW